VLLDPFEEQFDLPAAFIKGGNGRRWQKHIVGDKNQRFVRLRVLEANAAQMLGIALRAIMSMKSNTLIADNPFAAIRGSGIDASRAYITFCAGNEECAGLMQIVQP